MTAANLFADIAAASAAEQILPLHAAPNLRIERIVSHGQASAEGFWYDQDEAEWVLVLAGSAGLQFEGEAAPRVLGRGDHVHIPPHARHRVAWTDAAEPTIWLAVHYR
jgi:cupin 2 domain-containing protein